MADIKLINSYLLIVFISLGSLSMVNGLAIGDKCDHDKLAEASLKATSCAGDMVDKYLGEFLKEFDTQLKDNSNTFDVSKMKGTIEKIYNDATACVTDFSKACLDDSITDLANLAIKAAKPIFTAEVTIDKIEDPSKLQYATDVETKFKTITKDYDEPEKYLESLFKSDKECSVEKIMEDLEKNSSKCFEVQIKTLEPLNEYIQKSDKVYPQYVSLCQTMDNMMRSCFFETKCISKREMLMVRNLALSIYQIEMDAMLKIKDHFGTIPNMMTKIKTIKLKYNTEEVTMSEVFKDMDTALEARVVKVFESALDDYKGDTCKGKVKALAKESGSEKQFLKYLDRQSGSSKATIGHLLILFVCTIFIFMK